MLNEDIFKVSNGEMTREKQDTLSIKTSLSLLNFCINVLHVQKDVTDSALKFLMSGVINVSEETEFSINNNIAGGSNDDKAMSTRDVNVNLGKVENSIKSEISCDINNHDIDKFISQDDDLCNGSIDFYHFVDVFVDHGNC